MESKYQVVLVTAPTIETAKEIGSQLVAAKLAACVNILPGITSIYTWEEEICEEGEFLLMIKTRADLFEELSTLVQTIHPYDVPEVIAIPITAGSEKYLNWIIEVTR